MISIKKKKFGRCHAKLRAREIGWRPIVLRWRKRGRPLTNVIARRVETVTRVVSFPQFHFHFANHHTYRSLTNISRAATSSMRIFNTRVIHDEPRGKVTPRSLLGLTRYQRTIPADSGNSLMREQRGVALLQISGLKPASANVVASHRPTSPKYLLSQTRFRSRPQFAAKEKPALSFKTQSRFVQPHPAPSITARARNTNNAPELLRQKKPVPPQYSRMEELIWRRVSKTTTDIDELARRQNVIDSSEPLSSRSSAPQPAPVDPAHTRDAAPAGFVTRLDPALMDRLANDVIRRMEKRVRIERERRGL